MEQLVAKVKAIKVGNGLDEASRMGPVAGAKQFKTITQYIEIGKRESATLRTGGNALTEGEFGKGYFVAPTVFADVDATMRIAKEEIFGPVLSVFRAKDFSDALRQANDTIYGLASSIYTQDIAKAQKFVGKVKWDCAM